ncbi:MAG: hypothetical protein IJX44_07715 [Bacteroidaceae bacterium]|nr:hypothetical protein [Bacteroidaceae bacterium]
MKEIGGYFSLEIKNPPRESVFHSQGLFLNSGRNALEYILSSLSVVSKLWIPYFTCDVILEPIKKSGIPYDFYRINEHLELCEDIQLASDEYLLATNYYGIKDSYIENLAEKYGPHLIVDNAQALYAHPIEGTKTLYSPRKFAGIPDGGIAYMEDGKDIQSFDTDVSYDRLSHLLKRIDLGAGAGYADFRENSRKLANQPIMQMSKLTKVLFASIDFEGIKERRLENFQMLHKNLKSSNKLMIPDIGSFSCPLVYPYFTDDCTLKKKLIDNKIFVATYWPNVLEWCSKDMLEYQLANGIIAIPIDQRYGEEEMKYITNLILS